MVKQKKRSAGLLMFRKAGRHHEVFLVHPGGPYWAKKDKGGWTVPKGEYEEGEEPLRAAEREFIEETGFTAHGPFLELGSVRQKSGKVVQAWAFAGDCDAAQLISNTCEIEWPPKSNRRMTIPEVDRGGWFTFSAAADFIRAEQRPLLTRLENLLRNQ
jgi:predicted NUDIX family NTP pyrophosphohydrolase